MLTIQRSSGKSILGKEIKISIIKVWTWERRHWGNRNFLGKSKRGKDHITEGFIYPVMEFFNAGGCKHSRILNSGSNNKYTSQQCGKLIGGEKLYAHRK